MANDTAFTTAPFHAQVSVGNLMWQAMALHRCSAYIGSRNAEYLASAQHIADWVLANRRSSTDTGGFIINAGSGVASTEHNIDAAALFRNLHASTGNAAYLAAQHHAAQFVGRMWNNDFFVAGSLDDGSMDKLLPVPLDAQAWINLAAVDDVPAQNLKQAIGWAVASMLVNSTNICNGDHFFGSSFSQCSQSMKADGTCGVHNEETASLALALLSYADHAAEVDALLASLQSQQLSAPVGSACTRPTMKGPANGIVATPVPTGVNTGFYYCYPNAYHVASTAWTGLAMLAKNGSKTANPFVSCDSKPRN
jgi:hypothetical protein